MTRTAPSQAADLRPPTELGDAGVRELMAAREIVHAFLTAERPEEVYQFALNRVSPLVGAAFACVYVVDGESELMRLAAVYNWPQRYARFLEDMRVRVGFGPSGEAASDRRAVEIPDVFANADLHDWQDVAMELGFRALVALPLQSGQVVAGTVTFYFADPGSLTADNRNLLRMVADQMAATAEKARLISDLRQANAALVQSNTELERQFAESLDARRLKDEFLANVSHELRTPLTAVIGYISLMQEGLAGPMTSEQHHTLGQVKTASEQLLGLIGDLLELTTLKYGGTVVHPVDFDPREPLREAVSGTAGRPEGVALEVAEPEDPPRMHSDGRKIARILCALLANAYKFTERGKVRVSLQVSGDRATYAVEDTGIGIPADAQRFVFEEFRQVDGTMTRRYGGSGLGLALARRLAGLLGGDISVTSAQGSGSTFRVELPLEYDARNHS